MIKSYPVPTVVRATAANLAQKNAKSLSREKIGLVVMKLRLLAQQLRQIAQPFVGPLWNVATSALGSVAHVAWVEFMSDAS